MKLKIDGKWRDVLYILLINSVKILMAIDLCYNKKNVICLNRDYFPIMLYSNSENAANNQCVLDRFFE